jgi:hypothetical protein
MSDSGGFSGDLSGQCGTISYCEPGKSLEVYWELSGAPQYDILVAPVDLTHWRTPADEAIPRIKQREIFAKLRRWLQSQGKRADIDPPSEIRYSSEDCVWSGCKQKALMNSAYCLEHFR